MTRRIAVTGATGFIGRHLVAHLSAGDNEIRAVVRPESRHSLPAGATVVRVGLDASTLGNAFDGVDAVVHLAGLVSTSEDRAYTAVNVEGTRAVAEAARAAGARMIHVSSLAAAGPAPALQPRVESDPPAPVTSYGRSKLESERIVSSLAGLDWMILRPGVVYGPADRAMLPLFRLAKLGLLPLVGRGDAAYTVVHVGDVVRAIEAALAPAGGRDTLFVGHPHPATAREIVTAVRTAVGRPAFIVPIPMALAGMAAPVCDAVGRIVGHPLALNRARYAELAAEGFVCRVDRLRDRLGVVAEIGLREGLAETAAWYRQQGWL